MAFLGGASPLLSEKRESGVGGPSTAPTRVSSAEQLRAGRGSSLGRGFAALRVSPLPTLPHPHLPRKASFLVASPC